MYNRRLIETTKGISSLDKELRAIKENRLEDEMTNERIIEESVVSLTDFNIYESLKKTLLKITKAS